MTPRPATAELVAFALAVRPEWDEARLRAALAAAAGNGWPFGKTALAVVRLMFTETGSPEDLRLASRPPLARAGTRGDYARGYARAREALETAGPGRDGR